MESDEGVECFVGGDGRAQAGIGMAPEPVAGSTDVEGDDRQSQPSRLLNHVR